MLESIEWVLCLKQFMKKLSRNVSRNCRPDNKISINKLRFWYNPSTYVQILWFSVFHILKVTTLLKCRYNKVILCKITTNQSNKESGDKINLWIIIVNDYGQLFNSWVLHSFPALHCKWPVIWSMISLNILSLW